MGSKGTRMEALLARHDVVAVIVELKILAAEDVDHRSDGPPCVGGDELINVQIVATDVAVGQKKEFNGVLDGLSLSSMS